MILFQAMGGKFEDAREPFTQALFQARSPADAAELSIVVQHVNSQEVFGRGALSIGCASSGLSQQRGQWRADRASRLPAVRCAFLGGHRAY